MLTQLGRHASYRRYRLIMNFLYVYLHVSILCEMYENMYYVFYENIHKIIQFYFIIIRLELARVVRSTTVAKVLSRCKNMSLVTMD